MSKSNIYFYIMNITQFKYIKNISTDGAVDIRIFGEIGVDVFGSQFASEMAYLQDMQECNQINVRINSIGGLVLDGYSIISSILNSTKPCHTYIDGLAASIAGVIAVCGEKVHMSDYGTLMMHNPSGGEDQAVLNLLKDTLVTVFKNRTSLQDQQIHEMMNKETWMNAKQAMEAGMIDEIITHNKKVNVNNSLGLKNMVLIYNKLIQPNKMILITNKLGISEGADETAIVESIESLQAEKEALKAELEAGKVALEEMLAEKLAIEEAKNAELEANKLAAATEMVNSFKVKEEDKEATIKLALVDFNSVKNMLSASASTKAVKVFDAKNVVTKKGTEDRSAWTIRDWDKKDSKGLLEIRNTMPDTYKQMYFDHYKVYPQI